MRARTRTCVGQTYRWQPCTRRHAVARAHTRCQVDLAVLGCRVVSAHGRKRLLPVVFFRRNWRSARLSLFACVQRRYALYTACLENTCVFGATSDFTTSGSQLPGKNEANSDRQRASHLPRCAQVCSVCFPLWTRCRHICTGTGLTRPWRLRRQGPWRESVVVWPCMAPSAAVG